MTQHLKHGTTTHLSDKSLLITIKIFRFVVFRLLENGFAKLPIPLYDAIINSPM